MKRILLIDYRNVTLNDPPFKNTINYFLENEWSVSVILSTNSNKQNVLPVNGYKLIYFDKIIYPFRKTIAYKMLFPLVFAVYVKLVSWFRRHDLIITVMLQPVAVSPKKWKNTLLVSSILDIPPRIGGKLDTILNRLGWKNLKKSDIVWSSDEYKAVLAQKQGNLKELPLICYNCPTLDYLEDNSREKSLPYFSRLLNDAGINYTTGKSIVLLRAGAIGEFGGIEETLSAMTKLADNFIFVMMGRPIEAYKEKLKQLIAEKSLTNRVILFDKVSDSDWKKILVSSDIGHLIHIRPNDHPYHTENFDLNSSLSNNRLFQYMAAGLPIISYNDPRMNILYNQVDCFEIVDTKSLAIDIENVCNNLVASPKRAKEMGINGREAHLNKFNWENQFLKVTRLIIL